MERSQENALRAMRRQYTQIMAEEDARKGRVITGAYRGMENREFTMQGIKLVHNVRGEVLALGTKPERLQERLEQYSALLELDEVSEEDKTMVRMFTSAIQKRIEDLEYMRENNLREVDGVNKDIIRTRIQEYTAEIAGVSEEERNRVTELENQLESARAMVLRARGRWEESAVFNRNGDVEVDENGNRLEDPALREQYENAARRVQELEAQLEEARSNISGRTTLDPNSPEYHRLADVLPELEDILAKSNNDLEYVTTRDLNARLRRHRARRDELLARREELLNGGSGNGQGQEDNSEEIARLQALLEEKRAALRTVARTRAEARRDGYYEVEAQANSEYAALVEEINGIEKQIEELQNGNRNPNAEEIARIEALINEKRESLRTVARTREEARREGHYEVEAQANSEYAALVAEIGELEAQLKELNERGSNDGQEPKEEIVVLEEGVEGPGMPSMDEVLRRVAEREGIDPSELEAVWDGADGKFLMMMYILLLKL